MPEVTATEALATALRDSDPEPNWIAAGVGPWKTAERALSNLPDGWALVSVEDVARRLHDSEAQDGGLPHQWPEPKCDPDHYRDEARRLLGIGGQEP